MNSIYNYTRECLEDFFKEIGESKFRALQVFDWLYIKRVKSFDEMTNLKKDLTKYLKKTFSMEKLKLVKKQSDVDVKKYLFELFDGNKIEAVLMHHDYGNSLCVSTQVGCNMGCRFCESGRLKKLRNLSAFELVLQVLAVEEDIKDRVSHVVLMGIGEPFDNYDNVMKFINIINDPKGINIGIRHITVSTCGIVPKIKKFIGEKTGVNLAISLHAPTDEIRNKIMPINKRYPIENLMAVLKRYSKNGKRMITFEWVLIKDINDSVNDAYRLVNLKKEFPFKVNVIPMNPVEHAPELQRPNKDIILRFKSILKDNGIEVVERFKQGQEILAGCGQLAVKNL